jgi:hypothetical protein
MIILPYGRKIMGRAQHSGRGLILALLSDMIQVRSTAARARSGTAGGEIGFLSAWIRGIVECFNIVGRIWSG